MQTEARAPGKAILLGEHAVVYGRPAIAVPVAQVQASATVEDAEVGSGCWIVAHDLERRLRLERAPAADCAPSEPLALAVWLALRAVGHHALPDWRIHVRSQIPVAGGLGSGAAVSTALVRAVFAHVGRRPTPQEVSALVFRTEELHHGTPSGIDNTVIAYEQPIWFVKGQPARPIETGADFLIAIADSGRASPTRETVADVRAGWHAAPAQYHSWFDRIGGLVEAGREALRAGCPQQLGPLLTQNQELLEALGVSSERIETLVQAALAAGALGAKLSGAGRGGNIIALVTDETAPAVEQALLDAGALRVLVTRVAATHGGVST